MPDETVLLRTAEDSGTGGGGVIGANKETTDWFAIFNDLKALILNFKTFDENLLILGHWVKNLQFLGHWVKNLQFLGQSFKKILICYLFNFGSVSGTAQFCRPQFPPGR
jgi:hypothetical protein